MDRTILHCDCNGFYASVECILNPELLKVPMAVGGSEENRHGIILAKNELAKKYNIQTAETIYKARQKCPQLVVVPPHHDLYLDYSHRINAIYQEYTDLVEPFGIDESWLDVTGSRRLFGDGKTIADRLRLEVKEKVGLTISVGVSFNKVFAKLGSDYKKPDATTVLAREDIPNVVHPLPVSDLLFVGAATLDKLKQLGIHTIGQLAACDEKVLAGRLGKQGHMLWIYANGQDTSPVSSIYEQKEVKSIGNGTTFAKSLVDIREIQSGVNALADSIAMRMRKHNLKCSTLQVVIRDDGFKNISRQAPLAVPTYLSKEIRSAAMDIIGSCWSLHKPIRMITVTGLNLVPADKVYEQLDLFSDTQKRKKDDSLENTLDALKQRFGDKVISMGINKDE